MTRRYQKSLFEEDGFVQQKCQNGNALWVERILAPILWNLRVIRICVSRPVVWIPPIQVERTTVTFLVGA
jgi:hypothetical protein